MAKVAEEKPQSFTDYVKLVEGIQKAHADSLWYRGCGCTRYQLLPSLYRHRTATVHTQLAPLENQVMTRFRQRSIPMHSRSLADDWDALFFMQHYGVPTRLLDWTENPFMGLYFAVMSAPFARDASGQIILDASGQPQFGEDSAVWILDPVAWNRHSLRHQSYDGGVLTPGDDALKGFRPSPTFAGMNNHSVALYGAHNSPRIVAQRGVFTIFGQNTKPMEIVFDTEKFPDGCLIKVVLEKPLILAFRNAVLNFGMTESVVFPDLDWRD